jgi:hypothetical protein
MGQTQQLESARRALEGCRIHKGRFRISLSPFDADSDWCGFGFSQNVALVMPLHYHEDDRSDRGHRIKIRLEIPIFRPSFRKIAPKPSTKYQ